MYDPTSIRVRFLIVRVLFKRLVRGYEISVYYKSPVRWACISRFYPRDVRKWLRCGGTPQHRYFSLLFRTKRFCWYNNWFACNENKQVDEKKSELMNNFQSKWAITSFIYSPLRKAWIAGVFESIKSGPMDSCNQFVQHANLWGAVLSDILSCTSLCSEPPKSRIVNCLVVVH